jgi:TRAP-type uncharacterized transport system fused permease subunit
MFIYNTALLADATPLFVVWSFLTAVLGTIAFSVGLEGYLFTYVQKWRRPIYIVAGILCLIPEVYTDWVGLVLSSLLFWLNYRKQQQEKSGISSPTPSIG